MTVGKFIGCVMMVVGSAIGAGILAMPIQIAGGGFVWSAITILVAWSILTLTGLLVAEVSLALPGDSCSFASMAAKTLGTPGRIITWVSYLLLLCSILCAYVSGESSLITSMSESIFHLTIPSYLTAIIFVLVFGGAVYWSTKTVDFFNRGFISIKGFLLIATLVFALPHINVANLFTNQEIARTKYLFIASPVFLHMFNFHFVIPSIRMYVGERANILKWIIIVGTSVSLIIYLLWAMVALGIVPLVGENSFYTLTQLGHPADNPDFIKLVTTIVNSGWVSACINGFYNVSMTTSFLGVSLGLFDFLADGLKRPNTHWGRLQTACLTFIPPVIFAFFFRNGFIMALNYAASFIAILSVILPVIMVYHLRKSTELKSSYRAFGNNALFFAIILFGCFMFFLAILTNLHLLPEI